MVDLGRFIAHFTRRLAGFVTCGMVAGGERHFRVGKALIWLTTSFNRILAIPETGGGRPAI